MLDELRIKNFAIIDSLDLRFAPGFNVITGETGAGKSIIVDAVELLMGGKADSTSIRAGADRTIVEGVFRLEALTQSVIKPILEEEELTDDDNPNVITLAREVRRSGRSTARINGVTVNLETMARVGDALVDVHGQNAHMSLFKPTVHIDLLDRYAGLMEARVAVGVVVNRLHEVRREIKQLMEDEATLKRRADMLRHEVEQIEAASLESGEDEDLRAERNRLAHSERLAQLSNEVLLLLSGSDSADAQLTAVDQLSQAAALMSKLIAIDDSLKAESELATTLSEQAQDIVFALSDYADNIEYDQSRLDEVEERLDLIKSLQRRLNIDSVEGLIEYAEKAADELEKIENSEEHLEELQAQEDKLLRSIGEVAARVSAMRQVAAQRLSKTIMTELNDLRMERAQFEVEIEYEDDDDGCYIEDRRVAFDVSGIDNVEFLMSANPGEPLRPLAKVASGGEAARIMLALKRVLTQADQTPTLIFDEIDQGIGGRIGAVVGEKLWGLTGEHQVLVVTHLAQLAGYADRHYRVDKRVDARRTQTVITPLLDDDERADELAAMLGTEGSSGKQSARELIAEAGEYKEAHTPDTDEPHQQQLF
jgi:DNA repair protein RecN (Recombination protein N)